MADIVHNFSLFCRKGGGGGEGRGERKKRSLKRRLSKRRMESMLFTVEYNVHILPSVRPCLLSFLFYSLDLSLSPSQHAFRVC